MDDDLVRDVLSSFERQFPYALALLDAEFRITWVSSGFESLLGHRCSDAIGSSVLELVHPEDLDLLVPMAVQMVGVASETLRSPTVSGTVELPVRVRSAGGEWLPMAVSGRMFDASGALLVCLRLAVDRHALDAVLDCLAGGAAIDDTSERLVDLLVAQFAGAPTWLVHDQSGEASVVGPSQDPGVGDAADTMRRLRDCGPSSEIEWSDDRWIVPVLSGTGETLVAVFILDSSSIGEPNPYDRHVLARVVGLAALAFAKAESERTLRQAATTDYLTGALNRREIESRAMQLALDVSSFPVSLLYVDIDGFKAVNDHLGHEAGDEVLSAVARRLRDGVRSEDSVARLGGDEFAVLCPHLSLDQRDELVERLAEAVAAPIVLSSTGAAISVTASIGVASAINEDDLVELIGRADASMYERKRRRGLAV